MKPRLSSLDHLVLTVEDIPASVAFYTSVLGMRAEVFHPADGTTRTALRFGNQKINLHDASTPFAPHARVPTAGSGDLCFLSDVALSDWQSHLARSGVAVEDGPVERSGATRKIMSVYLRDPDGNLIEISNQCLPRPD